MIQFVKILLMAFLLLTQSAFAVQTIDSQSGLIVDEGYQLVKQYCSTCHSLKIVVQSKASYQGWLDTIRWMQQQGMPILSKPVEGKILYYLSQHYAPDNTGRRIPLNIKKWIK